MSIQSQFNKFEEKIRLTWQDDRLKKIREKDESIKEDIKAAFKEKGHSVQNFFNQGSYATKTSIVPLDDDYDIDVGVIINSKDAPENPIEVKKTLKEVLVKRNLKEPKIKKPCVTAQYYKAGETQFHLDYPIYNLDENGEHKLAIGKENANKENINWEETDPKGLIEWFNDTTAFTDKKHYAQYKRCVRYMKRWRDFCFSKDERKKVYSIGLMVMIRESFDGAISEDGDISDLKSLKDTVDEILSKTYFSFAGLDSNGDKQYEIEVLLPKSPKRDVFEKHGKTVGTKIYKKLNVLSDNLDKAIKKTSVKEQSEILNKNVFGDDFPIPDKDDTENKKHKESGYVSSPQGA